MRRNWSLAGKCAAALSTVLVVVACGGGASETPKSAATGEDVLAAAKKEGSVSFYAGLHDEASVAQVKMFEEKYPDIDVDMLLIGGEEQFSRVMQEEAAGLDAADVVAGGDLSHFLVYQDKGMLAPYVSSEHDNILPEYRDDEGYIYSPYVSRYVMAYNPKKIPEAEAPKSWKDLGDPKWKDQIVTSTPSSSAIAGIVPFVLTNDVYGDWELFKKIGANKPLLLASTNDVYPAVATGERPLAFVLSYEATILRQNDGEDIAPIFPEEGTVVVKPAMSIMKGAKHPNAARLLVDFLLSQEAQQVFTEITGRSPTRADVDPVPGTVALGDEGVKTLQVDYKAYAAQLGDVRKQFDQYMAGR